MATADSSSKGTTHWKKITVQEMQGAMDAGSLKASLKQRFSNETLHKLPATNGANSSQQPGFESQANANDSAGNSHQAEHKEKSAVGDINVLAPGNDGVAKSTEPKAHSTTVPDTTVVKVSTEVHRGSGSTAAATSDLGKKQRRAERFGLSVQLSEDEKRKARAARFGGSPADSLEANSPGVEDLNKAEEDKKRKARAERFGLLVSSSVDEETKKKARLARFGMDIKCDSVEEEKREARAARFALPDNNSTSILNKKV